jgi:hypothetical protein
MTYFPSEVEFILGSGESLAYERIQQGSSAYASFEIGWNNHLNGRVVDSEGNPIVRVKLSVLAARSPSPSVVERDDFDYHPEGKFEFYGLNPGHYLLSADIRAPFTDNERATTFYYPSAIALDQAREISIRANETLDEREIRLPPGYLVRQIEGVLVWPDGGPVSEGWYAWCGPKTLRMMITSTIAEAPMPWEDSRCKHLSEQITGYIVKTAQQEKESPSRSRFKRLTNR